MAKLIKRGQILSLKSGLRQVQGVDDAACLYIASQLVGRDLQSLGELSHDDWYALRDEMYPGWHREDWTLSEAFRMNVAALFEQYREDCLGQKRLF